MYKDSGDNMKRYMDNNSKIIFSILFSALIIIGIFPHVYASENEQVYEKNRYFDENEGSVCVTISIGKYEMKNTNQGNELYVENFGRLLVPGRPNLPSKIFSIAIPPGAKLLGVNFNTDEGVRLPGTYDIPPSSITRIIGKEDPHFLKLQNEEYENNFNIVYGSDEKYPSSIVEVVRNGGYRKYNLVDIRITPFYYYPLSKRLVYYSEINVEVNYRFADDVSLENVIVDDLFRTEKIAKNIIVNYNQAKNWYPEETIERGTYDYVIITLDSLTSSVTSLVDWEESKGRTVKVVTMSWIDSNYDGWDLAEKIRNFLRDKYPSEEWGIEDVCIIGHWSDIPIRTCSQFIYNYGPTDTDFYYAELSKPDNESWDSDGDHKWGENSDPIDFYTEINVGRIPWSDPETVEHICDKSVAYEQNEDPSFKKNVLLLGAFFWPNTDNAVLMEAKVNQTWMYDWTMTRLYEQGQSNYPMDYNLDYNNVKSVWSQGKYAFVNWAGHGSPTACYEYYPSVRFVDTNTCTYLNDDYPAIIFADACSNSDTDYLNIGQAMLKKGAVGFVGATTVALGCKGWNDPYDGSSQSLDYFFTIGITSGAYTQGGSHQWALREMYTNGLWSKLKYETFEWGALWGNPDLRLAPFNPPPEKPESPDGPSDGITDVELEFSAVTTDPEDEQIYYKFDWGDGNFSEWIGPYNSSDAVEVLYSWKNPGEYSIKVIAKDIKGFCSEWSDALKINILQAPILDVCSIYGGLFKVNALIKNLGDIETSEVNWNIKLKGGAWIGGNSSGSIPLLKGKDQQEISSNFIIGFGNTIVTITASSTEDSHSEIRTGSIFLIFVQVNPGYD